STRDWSSDVCSSDLSGGSLKARIRLADDSLYDEEGTLDFIDVQVDPRTDGQTLRATFPNANRALTEGQSVRVILEEKKAAEFVRSEERRVGKGCGGA